MAQRNDSLHVKLIHTFLLFPFTGLSASLNAGKLRSWELAPNILIDCFTPEHSRLQKDGVVSGFG